MGWLLVRVFPLGAGKACGRLGGFWRLPPLRARGGLAGA